MRALPGPGAAEPVHADRLAVKAVVPLLDQHRPPAFEPDGHGDQHHDGQQDGHEQRRQGSVEEFLCPLPAFERAVEDRQKRQIAEVAVGLGAELEIRRLPRNADVHRQ
jgi:hypothetical protein